MTRIRLASGAAALLLLAAASASAEPAYVVSTVNLRSAAGTGNEIIGKIPAGSLVDASNCTDWCEVAWQDKRGFAIATSIDRSGRVPGGRVARRGAPAAGSIVEDDDSYVVGAPTIYAAPGPYYAYQPYYWGYGPRVGWGWGYGRGYGYRYGYGYRGRRW
jgi:uncharacterized protein YraI